MSSILPELHVTHRTAFGPTESRSRMLDHQYCKVVDLSDAAREAAYGVDQTLLALSGPLSRLTARPTEKASCPEWIACSTFGLRPTVGV